jgi:K+:H+ antiporter
VRPSDGSSEHLRLALFYGAVLAVAAVLFFLIRAAGEGLAPGAPAVEPAAGAGGAAELLPHILLALGAVLLLGRALSWLLRPLHQPPVIGEVLAGILLGPSLLGPEISQRILPLEAAPALGVVAQLGVVLFMFMVGLELDAGLLRRRAHAAVAISHAGIVVPFLLGTALALWLYPRLGTEGVSFTVFALFLGVAMAITAFPVLARILTDYDLERTPLGVLALGVAAVDDVTAWCLLALVVGLASAGVGSGLAVAGLALAFVAVMFLVGRPVLARVSQRWSGRPPESAIAGVFIALFAAAFVADEIGIHAIFGAFLLGAITPHDGAVARFFERQLRQTVTVFLLPAFFAYTGMRTRIDLLSTVEAWAICGLLVVVATAGKLGGVYAAARVSGVPRRPAAALGALMNARGLMQLIALTIGFELGVISPTLFAMMVLMALITTMSAAPLLRVFLPERKMAEMAAGPVDAVPVVP